MHLAYIDDSGRDDNPKGVLFGAMIITDQKLFHVEQMARVAVDDLVAVNGSFVFKEFHAKYLFRDGVEKEKNPFKDIPREQRIKTADLLLTTIRHFDLQFVYGAVNTAVMHRELSQTASPREMAFRMCILGVEDWARDQRAHLPKTVPVDPIHNLVLCIVDDSKDQTTNALLRECYRNFKFTHAKGQFALHKQRGWHLHDGLYFGESFDSVGLQLSDFCGFLVGAALRGELRDDERPFFEGITAYISCAKPEPEWTRNKYFLLDHDQTNETNPDDAKGT